MAHDETCIFCKIINGEIPSTKIFENEDVLAFLDLSQVTKGHTLVIPKDHQKNIFHLQPETAGKLFEAVPDIASAIQKAFNAEGLNVLNNNEEIAGQTVFHYHLHLIPRYDNTDGFGLKWETHVEDYTAENREEIAAQIRAAIG